MALLKTMISTLAGRSLAKTVGGTGAGPAGAVIGLALPFVLRRFGPLGMAGMAVGAWVVNRALKDQAAKTAAAEARKPYVTAPPIPMVVGD